MNVRVFAPAKINLTLKVGRPHGDGMHPLQSVVVFADVGDWVSVISNTDLITLRVEGPFASALEGENLVEKAASLLSEDTHYFGAELVLEKNLPVASGIGGGSSDAAATLKALNRSWKLRMSEGALVRFAARLGCDVPVCVPAQSAWMSGVGEQVEFIHVPELHAVLVNPGKPLPTPAVYRQFDHQALGDDFEGSSPPDWRTAEEAIIGIAAIGNDLFAPARNLMPELDMIVAALAADARVRHAALSGSGATMFALVDNRSAAEAVARDLRASRPNWWITPTILASA